MMGNYEIVFASGKITNSNAEVNTDLFAALKSGLIGFGIITRFNLKTIQLRQY